MKHIPILFSTAMVQAILDGRKTQTRRVVKNQSDANCIEYGHQWEIENLIAQCPYGQPGDILWVRESFNYGNIGNGMQPFYRADNERPHGYSTPWKPSIHMPKSACRIFLKVKSRRVERVQYISEEDAISEGIKPTGYFDFYENYLSEGYTDLLPYESFKSLWQSINGKPKPVQEMIHGKLKTVSYIVYPFDEESASPFLGKNTWRGKPLTVIVNPWVWVVEFERCERPENFII